VKATSAVLETAVPAREGDLRLVPAGSPASGAAAIVRRGTLAFVAVATATGPLVTPVLYGVSGDDIWFLTNRHALKAKLLRRDPHTAWVVRAGDRAVVMTGEARLLSPLHAADVLAAAPRLPAMPSAFGSWAARNPRQLAGFVRDSLTRPVRVMPHDFVLVRLRAGAVSVVDLAEPAAPDGRSLPDRRARGRRLGSVVPAELRSLTRQSAGVLGLATESGPVAVPVRWDHRHWVALLPGGLDLALPGGGLAACITFDEPVHARPTGQRGVILRGRARVLDQGEALAIDADRVTYWSGFTTRTAGIPA